MDGRGHTIQFLTIYHRTGLDAGFFREIRSIGKDAIVKNIVFYQPHVEGSLHSGVLAGSNSAVIENVNIEGGSISATDTPKTIVGGLVGWNKEKGSVISSYFDTKTTRQTKGIGGGTLINVRGFAGAPNQDAFVGFGWNFDTTWSFTQGAWPRLAWQK